MAKTIRIELSEYQSLPEGWGYGAHVSGDGWAGYYIVGDAVDAMGVDVIAVQRPDYNTISVHDVFRAVVDALDALDCDGCCPATEGE